MTISALQQSAFYTSPVFNEQVNAVVKEQALIKAKADTSGNNSQLANVVRNPSSYGFPPAIVAEAEWDITYDGWASDPYSADYSILSGVQSLFSFLTGYSPPAPPDVPAVEEISVPPEAPAETV